MTFRRPINLSFPRTGSSRFQADQVQPAGISGTNQQVNSRIRTAGFVTAGILAAFTFGVGAWTIGGWVFAPGAQSKPQASLTPRDAGSDLRSAPEAAERLLMYIGDNGGDNLSAASRSATGQHDQNRRGDAAQDDDAVSRASETSVQYAQALVGMAIGGTAAESLPVRPETVKVSRGDTLMALMVNAGAGRSDAHEAITALREVYSPRLLRPGQEIELTFSTDVPREEEEANAQGSAEDQPKSGLLMGLSLQSAVDEIVRVSRAAVSDDFVAEAIARPLERQVLYGKGTIDSSLFVAARDAGIPTSVMIELIRAFSYDVDFQREIQPGDGFNLLYEAFYDEEGQLAKTGEILVASLSLSGSRLNLYGFTPSSGITDFFDETGQAVRKALLRTPIDGARLSSGFGRRKHPILGYTKMHKGLDFAAPRGTPIYAAGDGIVESAGRNGSYGNYIRIRHHSSYKTAYAHMKGFAKNVRKGKRVKQGQVIGYVGTTGRSTGPHLHYEVLRDNVQVNPRKIKLPAGEKLKSKDLAEFQAHRARVDELRETVIARSTQMVQARRADCKGSATIDESGTAKTNASSEDGC